MLIKSYVIALLHSHEDILLLQRKDAVIGNGLYSLPGGSVDKDETIRHAIMREVYEEVGLSIPETAFELMHVYHRKEQQSEFLAFVFQTNITGMHPINTEPNKHSDMQFFNIKKLPENIIPGHKQAIESIIKNIKYSEHGW